MVQCLPMQGMCIRSLVGELRSHRPRGSLRASTRKAGEPKPEKSPRASTKTQHNQNFFKNFTYVLSSVQAYRCHSSYQRWWRCPTHSLRTKTSAPHHLGARRAAGTAHAWRRLRHCPGQRAASGLHGLTSPRPETAALPGWLRAIGPRLDLRTSLLSSFLTLPP